MLSIDCRLASARPTRCFVLQPVEQTFAGHSVPPQAETPFIVRCSFPKPALNKQCGRLADQFEYQCSDNRKAVLKEKSRDVQVRQTSTRLKKSLRFNPRMLRARTLTRSQADSHCRHGPHPTKHQQWTNWAIKYRVYRMKRYRFNYKQSQNRNSYASCHPHGAPGVRDPT